MAAGSKAGEWACDFLPDRAQQSGLCFGSKVQHCRAIAHEPTCSPHPQQARNEPNWFANRS